MPTGNFGDIFAGYAAKRMGLPVAELIIATNVNDILARTLATGRYEVGGVQATASPSMDIQVSSNFERLLFEAYGRDADAVGRLMAALAQSRAFTVEPEALAGDPRRLSTPARPTRTRPAATIADTWRETGFLPDPHTAVGLAVARRHRIAGSADGHACHRPSGQVFRRRRGGDRPAAGPAAGL